MKTPKLADNLTPPDPKAVVFRDKTQVLVISKVDGVVSVARYKIGKEPQYCDILLKVDRNDPILKEKSVSRLLEDKPKRKYRRKEDWNDPDSAHDAEVNLSSKKMNTRVSEQHLNTFNYIAKRFPTKRKALERAIELLTKDCEL